MIDIENIMLTILLFRIRKQNRAFETNIFYYQFRIILKIAPSEKILIFLYTSLEDSQKSTISNSKFKPVLHKN